MPIPPIWSNYRWSYHNSQVLNPAAPLLVGSLLGFFLLIFSVSLVLAKTKCEDLDTIDNKLECYKKEEESTSAQLAEVSDRKRQVEATISEYSTQLNVTQTQINEVQAEIDSIRETLQAIKNKLIEKNKTLIEKINFRNKVVRSYYQQGIFSPLELLFYVPEKASPDRTGFQTATIAYMFEKSLGNEAYRLITTLNIQIANFEADEKEAEDLKNELETDQTNLVALKVQLDSQRAQAETNKEQLAAKEEEYEERLEELSTKQQELLAVKFASAPVPLLAQTALGGCSSDIGKSSGFSPRYGFFSYGVPNKTGLNQYGAKGRAEDGQDYEEILKAYYKDFDLVDYDTEDITITVNGENKNYRQTFNNEKYDLEEYLEHLYEMPSGWDKEALRAQAIAARTYALYLTGNGKNSIQPNENNQVVKKEKNASFWIDAVKDTKGKVMVQNGNPIGAWYSSTHGGVVLKSGQIGWNDKSWTKQAIDSNGDVGGFSDLRSKAYDKSSPWFYCDWGYRSKYNSTAWLKEDEVLDIVNAYILWEKNNNYISHLSQPDKPTGDTWSSSRVREELGSSAIDSINSISVEWDSSGISKTIKVNGKSYNAQKFKNLFNIRAPANIQIKPTCRPDSALNCSSMYALFDVEVED